MTIRVLLADDHKIFRDGLRTLIDKEAGMLVVAEVENGRKAVKLAEKLAPNVIVMDVSMPDMNGIEATRKIMTGLPNIKVIGLSMHSDRRFVLGMLEAGASGYLLKDCAFSELAIAIRQFAKRQRTWFRKMEREGTTIHWIAGELPMEEKLAFALRLFYRGG